VQTLLSRSVRQLETAVRRRAAAEPRCVLVVHLLRKLDRIAHRLRRIRDLTLVRRAEIRVQLLLDRVDLGGWEGLACGGGGQAGLHDARHTLRKVAFDQAVPVLASVCDSFATAVAAASQSGKPQTSTISSNAVHHRHFESRFGLRTAARP
jgi:hypothetical protein